MFLRVLIVVLDALAVLGSIALSHAAASYFGPHPDGLQSVATTALLFTNPHMPSGLFLMISWVAMLYFTGGYNHFRMTSGPRMLAATARSAGGVFLFMLMYQFAVRNQTWSRFLMVAFTVSSATLVGLTRLTFLKVQSRIPRTLDARRVAIVGTGERAKQMAERIKTYGHQAFQLVGFIEPESGTNLFQVPGGQVLGEVVHLDAIVRDNNVAMIILASTRLNREENLLLANRVNKMGLQLLQMPSNWGLANPRMSLTDLGDLELVDLTSLAYPTRGALLKRILDLMVVIPSSVILLPVLMLIGLAIRISDRGPALFTQSRCGQAGQAFELLKFRSMVVNAETMRGELQQQNDSEGVLFKLREDPRITPVGRHLRRWSIDELPQLLNVLVGDMNLVGPRPLPLGDLEGIQTDSELAYWFNQRSKVKPGITGTWQVSDRRDLKMEDMVRLDIDYIQNWSVWGDILLLLRTIPAVIRGRGFH